MTQLFQNILTASFHGSVVILAVIVLRLVLKKTPKKFLCLLWLLAGIRLLMPFEIQSDLSLQPQSEPIVQQVVSKAPTELLPEIIPQETASGGMATPAQDQSVSPAASSVTEVAAPAQTATTEPSKSFDWAAAVPYIWLSVASLFLLYTIYSYLRLKYQVRESIRIPGGWESERIETAFILGFIRPKIYIPMGLPESVRKHILAHERTHLEKGDHWFKMIGFIALALHWFNPLVWAAYILLCKDIEMACDERVVQFMELSERKEYSAALLSCSTNRTHFAACPVAFGEVSVKYRIKSVLNYKKPSFWISLAGVLAIIFVAVCLVTSPPEDNTTPLSETVSEDGKRVVVVENIDQFLDAIGPDTEIQLQAGTYNLSQASNYGKETGTLYYSWGECYDGYQLVLYGVENLTIKGSGKLVTSIETEPRYANVIYVQNCANIVMEDFTSGHTDGAGECSGGVICLEASSNVELSRLGLYGCGVLGLETDRCTDVTLEDSDIYDCSNSAFSLNYSEGISITGCRIYDIGSQQYGGYTFFGITDCTNVLVSDCEISDSTLMYLMYASGSQVQLRNNLFTGNRARDAAFSLHGENVTLVDNKFEDNVVRSWYANYGSFAKDLNGDPITEIQQTTTSAQTQDTAQPQLEIHVSTVDELIAAIEPNRDIVLDAELYDFSTATGYGSTKSDYYFWEDVYDGPGLVICNVDNMTIRGNDGNVTGHTISATPRYADVLAFSACSNVTLSGFTAGHTKEPGSCMGGVIEFRDCDNMTVDNCGLYGCGILGVYAEYSKNIHVINSDIYECSQGGIQMRDTNYITLKNNTFRDLGGEDTTFIGCTNITMDGQLLNPQSEGTDPYGIEVEATEAPTAVDEADLEALGSAVTAFANALFRGDEASMKLYLASTYDLPIEIPEEVIGASLMTEQSLPSDYAKSMESNGYCTVTVLYRRSDINYSELGVEKMFLEMCRESGVWKVQYFALGYTEIQLLDKDLYNFTYAYLMQDLEQMELFLPESHTGTVEVYFGDGSNTVTDPDYSVGDTFSNAQLAGLDSYSAAVPFKESADSDSYTYLNIALQRRENKQTYTEGKLTRTDSEWVVVDYGLDSAVTVESDVPEGIRIETIEGENYTGTAMLIDDPSRVFLGTSTQEAFSKDIPGKRISEMFDAYPNAVAAVNAGAFFDDGTASAAVGSYPLGLTVSGGEIVWSQAQGISPGLEGFAGFNSDNVLVVADHNLTPEEAKELDIRDGCGIGPALIINREVLPAAEYNSGYNPRTAIGQREDGTVILLCINGRVFDSLGATYADVVNEMMKLGAANACLMQGGSATGMTYRPADSSKEPQLVSTLQVGQTQPRRLPTYWMVGPA